MHLSKYVGLLINFITIAVHTAVFVSTEVLNILTSVMETELIIYIIGACSIFIFLILEDHKNILKEKTEQIKLLENEINFLKKTERMRENEDQILYKELREYYQETNNKIFKMEKKIKKTEQILKLY